MGCMIDCLSPEVPDVDSEGVTAGMGKVEVKNINAFSRFFGSYATFKFELVIGIDKFVRESSFPNIAFPNNKEFRLVNIISLFF